MKKILFLLLTIITVCSCYNDDDLWDKVNDLDGRVETISRTICPLAIPPTAGLQLICPILFMSIVMRQVLEPKLAAAAAASQPACPAPITITSYLKSIPILFIIKRCKVTEKLRDLYLSVVFASENSGECPEWFEKSP